MTDYSNNVSFKQRSLKTLFLNLKEALTSIKILGGIVPNTKNFMDKILCIIKSNFEELIEKFKEDSFIYLDVTEENP